MAYLYYCLLQITNVLLFTAVWRVCLCFELIFWCNLTDVSLFVLMHSLASTNNIYLCFIDCFCNILKTVWSCYIGETIRLDGQLVGYCKTLVKQTISTVFLRNCNETWFDWSKSSSTDVCKTPYYLIMLCDLEHVFAFPVEIHVFNHLWW